MVDPTVLLWRIEEQQRADDHKAEQDLAAPTNLTPEHVIPQSWEQHWPLDDSQDDPIGWRTSHLHKLGNLPLTTGALNASLSNGPWHAPDKPDDKRRGLANHSLLKLNTALANGYPERFDERAVDERGKRLANIAYAFGRVLRFRPQRPPQSPAPAHDRRLTRVAGRQPAVPRGTPLSPGAFRGRARLAATPIVGRR